MFLKVGFHKIYLVILEYFVSYEIRHYKAYQQQYMKSKLNLCFTTHHITVHKQ